METFDVPPSGRRHLFGIGAAATGAALLAALPQAEAAIPAEPTSPQALAKQLAHLPRHRDFKTVPMILDHPEQWDAAALDMVIAYPGPHKQVWDNTEIGGPWLNVMRNSMNAQRFSFRHPDFLAVSATHGSAHLALFDDAMWTKYRLGMLTAGAFKSNLLLQAHHASDDLADHEDPSSLFGAPGNSIPTLQARGVVFLACHNAIWEVTGKLIAKGINPDRKTHPEIAAELTNHLAEGVVLTPGIVATIPELQASGFAYIK
ncbi:MAG TPA: transcriptional initiation protein Tat [Acidisoma sp.]|uniref:thiosulfate dehydrogenase n=1 Tax=Acidisoma sp. TaxID=1872115 RepID=UPI002D12CE45|nr:transcriptional initiation protein Tat [Acidisoma sp.]HTI01706.1 transcriptional initiation protein Tat [Acidisoma sp.]